MREQKKRLLSKNEEFLVLHSSKAREEDLKNVDPASIIVFFEKAKEKTNQDVQEMMLSVVCDPPEVSTSDQVSA
jgi:HKD family nuclease